MWTTEPEQKAQRLNPLVYGQIIFDKSVRLHNGEKIASSINGICKTGYTHAKEQSWTPIPYVKINSRCIKGLKVRPKTIKLLEEKMVESFRTVYLAMISQM